MDEVFGKNNVGQRLHRRQHRRALGARPGIRDFSQVPPILRFPLATRTFLMLNLTRFTFDIRSYERFNVLMAGRTAAQIRETSAATR